MQNLFGTLTAPQLTLLDANFTELYGFAKNLVSPGTGNVLIGTATEGAGIGFNPRLAVDAGSGDGAVLKSSGGVSASCLWAWNSATSGNNLFAVFATEASYVSRGSISYNRAGGLVAYNTTSDYRAKTIHGPLSGAGATIDALAVYSGTMIGASVARPMFVAHEVALVAPYAVTGEKDAVHPETGAPVFQQMDVSALVPLLVAELQSLRARVAAVEA